VKRIDPLTVAETTGGTYRPGGVPRVEVLFLGSWFALDFVPYRVRAAHRCFDTLPLKVLFLRHVITAAENQGTAVRVMGQWIDLRSLQHGAVLGAHLARQTTETLSGFFLMKPEERDSRVLQWGGRPLDLGDESYLFHFFPRLPIALVGWLGDDEFPPYSKILYDVSASNYMPTHGIAALTEYLLHRLSD
jgi:hypothetical protein